MAIEGLRGSSSDADDRGVLLEQRKRLNMARTVSRCDSRRAKHVRVGGDDFVQKLEMGAPQQRMELSSGRGLESLLSTAACECDQMC